MTRIVLRRLLEAIPVLLVIVTMTFFMVRLAPGGPFDSEKAVSPEIKKRLEAYYKMDAPLPTQYFDYLSDLVRGDLGPSFKNSSYSVNELILISFPVSMELGFYAICVALVIGLAAGLSASLKPNSMRDYGPMSLAMIGICIPSFVLGPLLVLVFGLRFDWFMLNIFKATPCIAIACLMVYGAHFILTRYGAVTVPRIKTFTENSTLMRTVYTFATFGLALGAYKLFATSLHGFIEPRTESWLKPGLLPVSGWDALVEIDTSRETLKILFHWESLLDPQKILPALTMGAMYAAFIARLSRGGMLEILSNDFIRTARAKGLSETRVVLRHAIRGGLAPVVSYLGPAVAGLVSGSFVIETIFQIPGLGRFFVESAFNRDYTMIVGTVLFYATLILLLNLLVDVLHLWLDPRLRRV